MTKIWNVTGEPDEMNIWDAQSMQNWMVCNICPGLDIHTPIVLMTKLNCSHIHILQDENYCC